MTELTVILCEAFPRWSPALHMAFARAVPQLECRITIHEVRNISDLRQAAQQWPTSLLGMEVDRPLVGRILSEGPSLMRQFSRCQAVALLNRVPMDTEEHPKISDSESQLIATLVEAGFLEVALSPRQLHGVVEVCRRFAKLGMAGGKKSNDSRSYSEQVRNALPWQPAMPQVG